MDTKSDIEINTRTDKSEITLVVGASGRPGRYAYLACQMLHEDGRSFIPIGISEGEVFGQKILDMRSRPELENIHTISLYISSPRQSEYIDYLISLNPQRIIFNPGTENTVFAAEAVKNGIITEEACTLVLIRSKQY